MRQYTSGCRSLPIKIFLWFAVFYTPFYTLHSHAGPRCNAGFGSHYNGICYETQADALAARNASKSTATASTTSAQTTHTAHTSQPTTKSHKSAATEKFELCNTDGSGCDGGGYSADQVKDYKTESELQTSNSNKAVKETDDWYDEASNGPSKNEKPSATAPVAALPATTSAAPSEATTPEATGSADTGPERLTPDEALGMEYTQDGIDAREKNATAIKNAQSNLINVGATANPLLSTKVTEAKANIELMKTLNKETKECSESAMKTAKLCLESGNSGIQTAMSSLGQLAPAIGMMSMNDTCSKFSKIMTMLNGAMGAYRVVCAGAKQLTENTCEAALIKAKAIKTKADKLVKDTTAIPETPQTTAARNAVITTQTRLASEMEEEVSRSNKYTPAYGMKIADGKGALLANAGANALQVAGTMMSGQKCDKESAAITQTDICQQYPSICAQQSATPIADYCVTNPNDITCVCSKNVNDPACGGTRSIDPGTDSGPSTAFNPADPSFSLDDASGLGPGFNADPNGLVNGGDGTNKFGGADGSSNGLNSGAGAGSGSAGGRSGGVGNLGSFGTGGGGNSPRGGGAGGLGGGLGGGGAGSSGGAGGAYGTGFNTDISHEGGSGAGAGQGGSGDASRKPSTEELLKAFLPGGEKDPKKAGALDGITSAGGLSIFQKITRGYQRNANSLIPE